MTDLQVETVTWLSQNHKYSIYITSLYVVLLFTASYDEKLTF